MVLFPVEALLYFFLGRLIGEFAAGPQLAVGMGIGTTHNFAAIFEYLNPAIPPLQFPHLLRP